MISFKEWEKRSTQHISRLKSILEFTYANPVVHRITSFYLDNPSLNGEVTVVDDTDHKVNYDMAELREFFYARIEFSSVSKKIYNSFYNEASTRTNLLNKEMVTNNVFVVSNISRDGVTKYTLNDLLEDISVERLKSYSVKDSFTYLYYAVVGESIVNELRSANPDNTPRYSEIESLIKELSDDSRLDEYSLYRWVMERLSILPYITTATQMQEHKLHLDNVTGGKVLQEELLKKGIVLFDITEYALKLAVPGLGSRSIHNIIQSITDGINRMRKSSGKTVALTALRGVVSKYPEPYKMILKHLFAYYLQYYNINNYYSELLYGGVDLALHMFKHKTYNTLYNRLSLAVKFPRVLVNQKSLISNTYMLTFPELSVIKGDVHAVSISSLVTNENIPSKEETTMASAEIFRAILNGVLVPKKVEDLEKKVNDEKALKSDRIEGYDEIDKDLLSYFSLYEEVVKPYYVINLHNTSIFTYNSSLDDVNIKVGNKSSQSLGGFLRLEDGDEVLVTSGSISTELPVIYVSEGFGCEYRIVNTEEDMNGYIPIYSLIPEEEDTPMVKTLKGFSKGRTRDGRVAINKKAIRDKERLGLYHIMNLLNKERKVIYNLDTKNNYDYSYDRCNNGLYLLEGILMGEGGKSIFKDNYKGKSTKRILECHELYGKEGSDNAQILFYLINSLFDKTVSDFNSTIRREEDFIYYMINITQEVSKEFRYDLTEFYGYFSLGCFSREEHTLRRKLGKCLDELGSNLELKDLREKNYISAFGGKHPLFDRMLY